MPTYNEYFILTPTTQINVPSPVTMPTTTTPLFPSRFDTSQVELVMSAVNLGTSSGNSDITTTVPSEFVSTTTVIQTTTGTTVGASTPTVTTTAAQMTTGGITGGTTGGGY